MTFKKKPKFITIEGKTYMYSDVVTLPTDEKTPISLDPIDADMVLGSRNDGVYINHHLYILSDEEVKVDDWFYDNEYPKDYNRPFLRNDAAIKIGKHCKKIIATTDRSLKIITGIVGSGTGVPLPQPSQSFIEKYVEEYNKGNVITEVMVEYWAHTEENIQYKINPKDNTITIRKIKDSWSREEVERIVTLAYFTDYSKQDVNEWIKENL